MKKTRVVIAGQIPPPYGGQNVMIQRAVAQFAANSDCESIHLPFFFTPDVSRARKGGGRKVIELLKTCLRLLRIRLGGPIDILLYPTGGPQRIPMIRDLLLLPVVFLSSRSVVLHFHAAGIAEVFRRTRRALLPKALRWLYGKAAAAIVMTEFNRRDPEAAGIKRILVVPYRIPDEFDATIAKLRDPSTRRLLNVGHLCADKGTPHLLEAFATLQKRHPDLRLELVGECLPPFTKDELTRLLDRLGIRSSVQISGVLTGRAKAEAFARATLFVFPTIAPYESFGLVQVEAMAWRLPIVASDWRGNCDVLTADAGAVRFSTESLSANLAEALEEALRQEHEWTAWGETNRRIFRDRYREETDPMWLAVPVLSISA